MDWWRNPLKVKWKIVYSWHKFNSSNKKRISGQRDGLSSRDFGRFSSYADFAALGYFRLYTGLDYKRFTFGVGYELWGNADEVEHMALFKIGVRLGKNPY